MKYTPDNYDAFTLWDVAREQRLSGLPVCSCCEEPIQDEEFSLINNQPLCDACLYRYFRVRVEEYIE